MPFTIVREDITKMKVDAIVNAANTDLQMGGGVCGAIFKKAGAKRLQAACNKLSPIKTGEAVITPGFDLEAKFIIHTAGPIYSQWNEEQNREHLSNAYANSLKIAFENKCESIAFPLISSGIYGYPKEEAIEVARSTIKDFLENHNMEVTLVIFDKSSFIASSKLIGQVKSYLDHNFHAPEDLRKLALPALKEVLEVYQKPNAIVMGSAIQAPNTCPPLDHLMENLDESFSQTLLKIIDKKNMTDVQVYKRANIDRKLFSKIRNNKGYTPSKRTALALALALELNLDETNEFLELAGYALSHAVKFDVIVEYFIENGLYDIFEINEVLFYYDQPLLGM